MSLDKARYLEKLLEKNILISPELLAKLERDGMVEIDESGLVLQEKAAGPVAVTPHTSVAVEVNEKQVPADTPSLQTPPAPITVPAHPVKILFSYAEKSAKRDVQHFVAYYHARFKLIESVLQQRVELSGLLSLGSLRYKNTTEKLSTIVMVQGKNITKNGNIILTVEDPTGTAKVIINKSKPDLFALAKDVVLDEVIGVSGAGRGDAIFANNIVLPDIPSTGELKKSPREGYAVFLSDVHVGSKQFLHEEFERFLQWIGGQSGSEAQREIARKVKYVFIAGDVVDGVGIYPAQEKELEITDIYQQYEECARLLSRIPQHIQIIMAPGNHDATRLSEPQPAFSYFAEALKAVPNLLLLSNPCVVNIDAADDFSGFNVLMYHGYSFDYYVANVDSIRQNGGYDRADLIMKFLLKRRHLAPSHTSTLYIPDTKTDPLFISTPPDIFITGHVHRTSVSHYKDVTLISGSCWQGMTPFQERLGHKPQPARVPVIDLKTRAVKILRFGKT